MNSAFRKGQQAFTNCYIGNRDQNNSFLCRGVIVEAQNDNFYRVLITGVNTFSIGAQISNRLLKTLLGKIIPRNTSQIQLQLSEITTKLYANGQWILWEDDKVKRIIGQHEKKHERRNSTDPRQ